MTERNDNVTRLERWPDEAGDEPTAFGKTIIDMTLEYGLFAPEDLNLAPHHAQAVIDHFDGIDNREHWDLPIAVAEGIGRDPRMPKDRRGEEDAQDLDRLAMAWTYCALRPTPSE